MKYSLALLALSASALGQIVPTDPVGLSVLQVLATAIPPESISKATADPAAFSSELDSSLRAGQTPEWYQALPSDVKSYLPQLYPAETPAETTAASTSAAESSAEETSAATTEGTGAVTSSNPTGGNSTVISTVSSPTLSSSSSGSPSTGAAAYPTAMVGSGIAGAMGILAMFAL